MTYPHTTDYINVISSINKIVEEFNYKYCTCNKFTKSKCNRCCTIDSLNKTIEDVWIIAHREED